MSTLVLAIVLLSLVDMAGAGVPFESLSEAPAAHPATKQLSATSDEKKADMKAHAVSSKSDAGKAAISGATQMADMPQDPATGIMSMIAPESPPDNTTSADQGSIGKDGKRVGKLSKPPSFIFPIIFGVAGLIAFICVALYLCVFRKEEKRSKEEQAYT